MEGKARRKEKDPSFFQQDNRLINQDVIFTEAS